jgi:DNA-directed RNA polymerase subunit K/omega
MKTRFLKLFLIVSLALVVLSVGVTLFRRGVFAPEKHEYTTMVGIRAQQIADGAKPLISLDGIQTSHPRFVWTVAEREIAERVIPFIVHRRLPNGISEYWNANELSVVW